MGSTTSRVPLPPPNAGRWPLPPKPATLCQLCWELPFSAYLGLVETHPVTITEVPKGLDDTEEWATGGYSYATSWKAVQSGATAGCSWCQLLLSRCYYPWIKRTVIVTVGVCPGASAPRDTPKKTQNLTVTVASPSDRGKVSTMFHGYVHTSNDDPAAASIVARTPILDVGSTHALALAKACLDECVHGHDRCIAFSTLSSNSDPLPTRVVDCTDPSRPFLASTAGKRGRYLALSYFWGEAQPHSTVMSKVSAYARGIDPSNLPRGIRDAIHVTHTLGFQYLWLDTLCIIQDSDEDKRHELALMHNIYRYAHLTIIAASAKKVSDGFLQNRSPGGPRTRDGELVPDVVLPFICPSSEPSATPSDSAGRPALRQVGSVRVSTLFARYKLGHTETYRHAWEPISTRAWCMQEYLMSPRALIFTSETLQFRCQTATKNVGDSFYSPGPSPANQLPTERGEQRLPESLFLPEPPLLGWQNSYARLEVYDAWQHFVKDYTRCFLSYPSDKLPACGAIASEFHRVLRCDYLAGLWRDTLLNDLLWRRKGGSAQATSPTSAAYRAPSWSWVAADGPVEPRQNETGQTMLAEVVRCEVTPKDPALPFGEVTGGTLVLRGALIRSVVRYIPGLSHSDRMVYPQSAREARRWGATGDSRDNAELKLDKKLIGQPYLDWADAWDAPRLWIILLALQPDEDDDTVAAGLIVTAASDGLTTERGRKMYRRVGYFEIEVHVLQDLGWDIESLPLTDIELI